MNTNNLDVEVVKNTSPEIEQIDDRIRRLQEIKWVARQNPGTINKKADDEIKRLLELRMILQKPPSIIATPKDK